MVFIETHVIQNWQIYLSWKNVIGDVDLLKVSHNANSIDIQ